MKTARNVPRVGLCLAKAEHLIASNETTPPPAPAKMQKCLDKNWKYSPSGDTDIRRLFARVRREQKNGGTK